MQHVSLSPNSCTHISFSSFITCQEKRKKTCSLSFKVIRNLFIEACFDIWEIISCLCSFSICSNYAITLQTFSATLFFPPSLLFTEMESFRRVPSCIKLSVSLVMLTPSLLMKPSPSFQRECELMDPVNYQLGR